MHNLMRDGKDLHWVHEDRIPAIVQLTILLSATVGARGLLGAKQCTWTVHLGKDCCLSVGRIAVRREWRFAAMGIVYICISADAYMDTLIKEET
jgi:hypothetical protein